MKHLQPSIGYPSTGTQDRLIDYNYYYQVAMYYVVSGVARIYFVVGTKIVKPRQFPIKICVFCVCTRALQYDQSHCRSVKDHCASEEALAITTNRLPVVIVYVYKTINYDGRTLGGAPLDLVGPRPH